jgi:hypothetical protein
MQTNLQRRIQILMELIVGVIVLVIDQVSTSHLNVGAAQLRKRIECSNNLSCLPCGEKKSSLVHRLGIIAGIQCPSCLFSLRVCMHPQTSNHHLVPGHNNVHEEHQVVA